MKKIILLLLISVFSHEIKACDLCGCSSGNYFMGPFPQFSKYFLGTRYSFRSFNTVLQSDNSQYSKDFYQTVELWGGLSLGNKWQVLTFAPYDINHSVTDDGEKNNNGFGDVTIMANYNLLNKQSLTKDTETVSQQLWLGGGMKIPSGQFNPDTIDLVSSVNSQPGSGSLDFLLSTTYSLQVKSWGINSNVNYKINRTKDNFKFGNSFYASAYVFRSSSISKATLMPNIGLMYEYLAKNKLSDEEIASTGGYVLLTALGMEVRFDKIGIGFNAQLPLVQNLSDSQTNTVLRGMLHLSYMF